MGKFYSDDIRLRVTGAVAEGASRRSAARRFAISVSSAIRWAERNTKEGNAAPRKQGRPFGKGPLAEHLGFLVAAVEAGDSTRAREGHNIAVEVVAARSNYSDGD